MSQEPTNTTAGTSAGAKFTWGYFFRGSGIFLVLVIVGLLIAGIMLPRRYRLERSVTITAPPNVIYKRIASLKAWQEWCAWTDTNPAYQGIKNEFSGAESGVGSTWSWTHASGNGKQVVTKTTEPFHVEVETTFGEFPPMFNHFTLEPIENDQMTLKWEVFGDVGSGPVNGWFSLFLPSMLAPDIEIGLNSLKVKCEEEFKNNPQAGLPTGTLLPDPNRPREAVRQ